MEPTFVLESATEGAPLLIADAPSAVHWGGTLDDGSGVLVEYMGSDVLELPKALLQKQQQGRQVKKFATLREAQAFQQKVLAAFHELHPEAAPHPKYPEAPTYYLGPTRVYSAELQFSTMLDAVLKTLKSGAQVVVFDKRRKAQGLFLER